jgi:plastocyanin
MPTRAHVLAAWSLAATVAGTVLAVPQAAATTSRSGAAREAARPAPPALYRVSGVVELTEKGRPASDASLDRSHAVVWYEPEAAAARPAPIAAAMNTARKQFDPQVLVVPVGSTVRFPNLDPILHNVFSVSGRNAFDLGLVGKGRGKIATFREAGLVRVFCNVHRGMFAHVLVVPTPFYARADAAGRFTLEGLPAGRGRLHFWHERGEPGERALDVPAAQELELTVEITQPRVPPHRNKLGRSYTGGSYE